MEGKKETVIRPTENGIKFWNTFVEVVGEIDPDYINYINKVRNKGSSAVIFTLGSGGSDAETSALTKEFPQALRIAVDINSDAGPLAKFYGFFFVEASASDPRIYDRDGVILTPDLVIIRNPSPADKEMWKEAIRLAWEKMSDGGILYLSSSHIDKSIVSEMISSALEIDKDVVEKKWLPNPNLLGAAFRDNFVICFQKRSS